MIMSPMMIAVLFLVGFVVILLLAYLIFRLPSYFRSRGMARLAKDFGLEYEAKHNWLSLSYESRNVIAGEIRGHRVKIYDSREISELGQFGGLSRQVKIFVDDVERPIFPADKYFNSFITPVSSIRGFLEKLKTNQN